MAQENTRPMGLRFPTRTQKEEFARRNPEGSIYPSSTENKTPTGLKLPTYGPGGVPFVEGSPLRREPNLDAFQQPLYEGGMAKLMEILNREGDTSGLISQSESTLSDILSGVDPAVSEAMFREKYLPSQKRTFEEETIPGIREAMVGAGDFWSTGRASLESKARTGFAERMESQLADLQREGRQSAQSGLSQVGDISGMRQRQELDRIREMLPFLNLPTQVSYLEPESGGRGGEGEINSRQTSGGGRSGRVIGEGGSGGSGYVPGMRFGQPGQRWNPITRRFEG